MNLKQTVFRRTNDLLGMFRFHLSVIEEDFDARLDQPEQVRHIFTAFAEIARAWLDRQEIFPVKDRFDIADALSGFYEEYLRMPFRAREGGSRFNNLAWLYVIARAMQPSLVIDSGTYRGASAWAFSMVRVPVYSFDLDLSRLAHRSASAVYAECDWNAFSWQHRDLANALIYFDDHLSQVRRLREASERSIPVAIFDDDFPLTSFAPMANGGQALPKIEFVLDDDLRQYREISWTERNRRYVFPLNHQEMEQARSLIAATGRLPETSHITGIQQMPYRLIRVNPAVR